MSSGIARQKTSRNKASICPICGNRTLVLAEDGRKKCSKCNYRSYRQS